MLYEVITEDLRNLALSARNGQAILLRQVAEVNFAAAIKRGDAGFNGESYNFV